MPQVYSLAQYQQLNPTNIVRWDELVQDNWDAHSQWETAYPSNPLASLAAQQRLFYPRSFTVSSSLTSLNNPWFIDYGHLMFWFFFISTFILVMWLVTLHGLASKNVENRFPRRETRGFSRAQTGDVMTAVLPLTWSITMLMHASTHSINFDENTAATSFSFTVIAYQWGWNYYFPRDIVEKLSKGPRLVGRGNIDMNGADTGYSYLLEKARNEYLARLSLRGGFADKSGREVASNFLTLYTRAGGAPAAFSESQLLTALWNAPDIYEPTRTAWRAGAAAYHGEKLRALASWESQTDVLTSSASWSLAGVGEARLKSFALAVRTPGAVLLRGTTYPLLTKVETRQMPLWRSLRALGRLAPASQPRTAVLNTARAPYSFNLVGNRLALIHKHLTSPRYLPAHLNARPLSAFYIKTLARQDRTLAPMSAMRPSWALARADVTLSVARANITPNLWGFRPSRQGLAASHLEVSLGQRLARGTTSLARFKGVSSLTPGRTPLNSAALAQTSLYTGSPYSLSYRGIGLASFDDLGPSNSTVTKELQKRLSAYASRAVTVALQAAPAKRQSTPNVALFNFTSAAARQLAGSGSAGLHSMQGASALYTPAPAAAYTFGWPLALAAAQAPELASARLVWALGGLPTAPTVGAVGAYLPWAHSLPLFGLRQASRLEGKLASTQLFSALAPFALAGRADSKLRTALLAPSHFSPSFLSKARQLPSPSQLVPAQPRAQALLLSKAFALALADQKPLRALTPFGPYAIGFLAHPKAPFSRAQLTFAATSLQPKALSLAPKVAPSPLLGASLLRSPAPADALWARVARAKTPALYSPWLEGPTPQRPVRSTLDKSNDPVNFVGKSDLAAGQPFFAHQGLFNWYWSWSASTLSFALPLNKLYRGAIARRAAGGFWNSAWANESSNASALAPETLLAVDKQAWPVLVGGLSYVKERPRFAPLTAAVLDNEWVGLAQTPACLTPEPFEDVDQAFVHQKWTLDLNTTRRSDHTSKYKVLWGPWASYKKTKALRGDKSPQEFINAVGVAGSQSLPTKAVQQIALFNENTLPLKTSVGSSLLTAQATSGQYYLDARVGAVLFQSLAPQTTLTSTANDWARTLRARLSSNPLLPTQRLRPQTAMAWASLWDFKLNLSDVQGSFMKTHPSAYPSYWVDRALLVLSSKQTSLSRLKSHGASSSLGKGEAVGAQHPLVRDILALYGQPQNQSKAFSLASPAWLLPKHNRWSLGLEDLVLNALDKTVQAHLLARANFSLVRDEIGSIRRLRVTKGIYLPSDIPMHVICGSKDVIHSWALPGLNVKIDCIPGFNSHRRLMLRWRGAYWGQCMEVCGRYHHWMPILIHVVHKDVFLGWCLSYLKLIEARAQATARAITMLTSVDVVTLDLTLATLLRAQPNAAEPLQGLSAYAVNADLEG